MKWAVYWQPDDIECQFFKTEREARDLVTKLIDKCYESVDYETPPLFWDITLMEVKGEVREDPDGLSLKEIND